MHTPLPDLNAKTARISDHRYPERVVQFGGGNFLRGFVDWMIEALNEQTDFASKVVMVKPTPEGNYEALAAQDCLFHVQLHGLEAGEPIVQRKLITCISRVVNPYSDYQVFLALARQPDIRFIVSNTTEAGIAFAPDDRLTDTPPASFPAKLTLFLYHRFQHFEANPDKGCIVLPCELIEHNGERLKQLVLRYADLWQLDTRFGQWLETNNLFCNTLVDRIVTGFPKTDGAAVLKRIGFNDQQLVEAEQYHSWVIEAPPALQLELPVHQSNLNVRIIEDIAPYQRMKVRILNGAHTAMMPLGYLTGLETVQQAVEHPWLGEFVRELLYEEILPSLDDPDAGIFAQDVLNRFHNPFIQHQLLSIALNSISKFRVRLLPSLTAYTANTQRLPHRIVLAFAALLRFYKGEWKGAAIPLKDDPAMIASIQTAWQSGSALSVMVENILTNDLLWGQDLTRIEGLADLVSAYLAEIEVKNIQNLQMDKTS